MYPRFGSHLASSLRLSLSSKAHRALSTGVTRQAKEAWSLPERDVVIRKQEAGNVILDIDKVKKEPFLKGMFQGKFDKEMLAFPEVLNTQQVDELEDKLVSIGFINGGSEEPTLEQLKEGGVFGLEVSDQHGGLGYTMTEAARVLEAVAGTSHRHTLLAHNFLVQALLKRGSEQQRERLLPPLARGELTAAFCCSEPGASADLSRLQCVARPDGSGRLRLSGTKAAVQCAQAADLLLVIVNMEDDDFLGNKQRLLSAVIVEKGAEGITYNSCDPGLGLDICDVEFLNTPVSTENVIGDQGTGHAVLLEVLNHVRTVYPAQLVGSLRPLVAMTTKHCVHRPLFEKHLSDFGLTRAAIGAINRDMYTMESLTYLTTGLVDLTLEPDYVLEAACCKLVASELAQSITDRCLRLLGDQGFYRREEAGDMAYRYLTETRAALRFTGSNELLRLFVALGGLHEAVPGYADEVTKMRNPMLYPVHVLRRVFQNTRLGRRSAEKLNLYTCLHPSLEPSAQQLEDSVQLFAGCCCGALERHGANLMYQQAELARLAGSLAHIYATVAVLARASRSYCIGLRDANIEMTLAASVAADTWDLVQKNAELLDRSPHVTPEAILDNVADVLIERGGYSSAHSLRRNY